MTGGVRRVGRAIVESLVEQGYDIVLQVHSSMDEARALQEYVRFKGRACEIIQGDLTDAVFQQTLMEQAFRLNENISVLVNAASVFEKADFKATSEDLLRKNIELHMVAPFILSQHFAAKVTASEAENSLIIHVTDTYVVRQTPAYFAYLLTKKGLQESTGMMARELGPGIRVNAIAPGLVLPSDYRNEAALFDKTKEFPLARQPSLDEIKKAVRLLIDHEYITGQCIFVDSGQHLM